MPFPSLKWFIIWLIQHVLPSVNNASTIPHTWKTGNPSWGTGLTDLSTDRRYRTARAPPPPPRLSFSLTHATARDAAVSATKTMRKRCKKPQIFPHAAPPAHHHHPTPPRARSPQKIISAAAAAAAAASASASRLLLHHHHPRVPHGGQEVTDSLAASSSRELWKFCNYYVLVARRSSSGCGGSSGMASSLASASWVVLPPVQARVAAAVAVGPTCRVLLAYTPLLSGSARRRVVGRPLAPPRCSALEDPGPSDGGEGNGRVVEEEVVRRKEQPRRRQRRRPVWRRILFASKKTRSIIILNALTVIYGMLCTLNLWSLLDATHWCESIQIHDYYWTILSISPFGMIRSEWYSGSEGGWSPDGSCSLQHGAVRGLSHSLHPVCDPSNRRSPCTEFRLGAGAVG